MSLFKLGSIVATPGALQFCEEHSIDPLGLIGRHAGGDFGDLDADDVAANVHGIKHDLRVFSSYQFKQGPDGHPKLLHLWPPKLPQAGRLNYQLFGPADSDFLSW